MTSSASQVPAGTGRPASAKWVARTDQAWSCPLASLRSLPCGVDPTGMTTKPQLSCRLHLTTGRLSCTYTVTPARSPYSGQPAPSGEAAERSRRESVRRARRRVNELIHDYNLRHMWTLSYATAPDDLRQVFTSLSTFSRRLRTAGLTTPRLIVPEYGPTTRCHLHMAVPVDTSIEVMSRLWGQGDVRGPDTAKALSEDALERVSSYLTKAFETTAKGSRRYVTSAGLRPLEQRFRAFDAAAALAIATSRFGAPPVHTGRYAGNFMAFYTPTVTASLA